MRRQQLVNKQTPIEFADESETETEQELRQKNVGSGESTNDNCGQKLIDSIAALECATVTVLPPTTAPSHNHENNYVQSLFLFSVIPISFNLSHSTQTTTFHANIHLLNQRMIVERNITCC
jgi:hypothetical protein